MKQNEDGKTVRAMDVLFPKIGEIIGGSEREADYDKLMTRIQELGNSDEGYVVVSGYPQVLVHVLILVLDLVLNGCCCLLPV